MSPESPQGLFFHQQHENIPLGQSILCRSKFDLPDQSTKGSLSRWNSHFLQALRCQQEKQKGAIRANRKVRTGGQNSSNSDVSGGAEHVAALSVLRGLRQKRNRCPSAK